MTTPEDTSGVMEQPTQEGSPDLDRVRELLAANVAHVRGRIAAAAEASGRSSDDVKLLPVTKYVDEARIRAVYDLGLHAFGENRVQEVRRKSADMSDLDADWILIGHLQTNKANQAARVVSQVQSVDSVRVAEALSGARGRAVASGTGNAHSGAPTSHSEAPSGPLEVLLQVNTSGEAAKYGFEPAEVRDALDKILTLPHLRVCGFMTMAPFTDDLYVVRKTFADLRDLRDVVQGEYEGVDLSELSMGMSHDYEIAVAEGATTVRVGTGLFGKRESV